jgi:NAD+ diphosphatase
VAVDDIRYCSSQPWPFPSSLMLGFRARYVGGEPATDDGELADVRWFERSELAAITRGQSSLQLPPPIAIARRLIDEWLG